LPSCAEALAVASRAMTRALVRDFMSISGQKEERTG